MYSQSLSIQDWSSDIDVLRTELPQKHINFFFKKSKEDFERELDKVILELNELSDFQVAVRLQQIIASFGDSHTKIDWPSFLSKDKILPIKAIGFSDGIYTIRTTKKNRALLEKKILKINDIEMDTIVNRLSSFITVDNQATVYKAIPQLLTSIQLLEYIEVVEEGSPIQIETEDELGRIEIQTIHMEPLTKENQVTLNLENIPLYLQNEKEYFWRKMIEKDKVYYIQYNRCSSKEVEQQYGDPKKAERLPSFIAFQNKVLNEIRKNEVNILVFDMRFNRGGNSFQGTQFIQKLAEMNKINQKGKLYVIVGRDTYSSAILNTLDFKKYTHAIIVGERTSGKPNHYGEVRSFKLPNSKLKVSYSTQYFKRVEKDENTIITDIEINISFTDFKKGIDPVLERILMK